MGAERSFITFSIIILVLATLTAAQTTSPSSSTSTATAHIPYDFWIEGTFLPAGDYTLSRELETVLVLRNEEAAAEEQAFLMPTRTPVSADDHKLIFLVQNGRHYLREIWNSDGRQVVTSEFGMPLSSGETTTQVPLVEKSQAREPNKATDSDPACVVAVSPGDTSKQQPVCPVGTGGNGEND